MDVAKLRAETPGCAEVVHLNNAGAALMPQPVLDAQIEHLKLESRIGGYESAFDSLSKTADTHRAIAEMLNASAPEIAVVENATRAWGAAFYGMRLQKGDRILTARASYASNYIAMLQVANQVGAIIDVAPDDETGQVDVAALGRLITPQTRLIAITHVPTNGGLINPAAEIGRLANRHGVPFLLDACQSVGQLDINVQDIGCDMLSATGRKFLRGPRGTGFLYVRRSMIERLEPPFLDLHAAEWVDPKTYHAHPDHRRFETWEGSVAAKIGLGVAVRYALDVGLGSIASRVQVLAEQLREMLRPLPEITVHDQGMNKSGIVTLSHARVGAGELQKSLRAKKINTSMLAPSSARLDSDFRGLPDMLRASVHYYNTTDELNLFVDALKLV